MSSNINILAITLLFFLFSCDEKEKSLTTIPVEANAAQIEQTHSMPLADMINGQELRIQLVTVGCFVEKDEPVITIKRNNKMYVASVYKNGSTVLSDKILDSSFRVHLKGFVNNCETHLIRKPSSPSNHIYEFRNVEKIIISDGLHINGIDLDHRIESNPFTELVSAIFWHGQNRFLAK